MEAFGSEFCREVHKRLLKLEQLGAAITVQLENLAKEVKQLTELVKDHDRRLTLEEGRILAARNRRQELLVFFAGLSAVVALASLLIRFF